MKKVLLVVSYIVLVSGLFGQHGWRDREMEVKVYLATPEEGMLLQSLHLETEPASADGRVINAYVVQSGLEKIIAAGLTYTITITDLNEHYRGFWNQQVPVGYYTYDQIVSIADSLATAYPSICQKVMYGTSVQGRELAALKISKNVNLDEFEPKILFDGGIHGDEVGGSQNMIMFARDLCKGYGNNPTYTDLIDSREIWIYYMVNPDGRVSMSRDNANLVDCNRDFGYMWDASGNSPGPCSQPESQALRNCLLDHQFTIYTNYHSGAQVISYPWSYRSDNPPDVMELNTLAADYSSSSGYPSLPYGQGYTIMYPINGSSKDFVYGAQGNIGWSIEISTDKQPPASQIPLFYNYNLPAMVEMISQAGSGAQGTITDSLSSLPLKATVWIGNYMPVNTDPAVGDYHKCVFYGPSSFKVTANGYKTKYIPVAYIPLTGAATINFQLVPDPHWYAYRVTGCQIPGNNFSDPGYTPGALGPPDGIPYALGKDGWIVLDMGDTIFNGPGADLKVYEAGTSQKGYYCYAGISMDGPWVSLGMASGTATFDLGQTSLNKARYIKIKDDGTGPSGGLGAGFNLDAVEMLTLPLTAQFSISNNNFCEGSTVDFTDQSTGNPVTWNWTFPGGLPGTSNEQNPGNIVYDAPGDYNVTLTVTNGTSQNTRTNISYVHVKGPLVSLGNDTTVSPSSTVLLDAGNPGCDYAWSTGATTQTILVDSSGVGLNSHAWSVTVTDGQGCTGSDEKIITFSLTAGIQDDKIAGPVSIYPNPSKGNIHIKVEGNGANYRLVSVMGVTVASGKLNQSKYLTEINFGNLPEGLYFLEIESNSRIIIKKLILE
jgi:PKD repeat protein